MFTTTQVQCETHGGQGSRHVTLAELRRQLASPSKLTNGQRQRLLDLARSVARVQALGGGYRRVSLSDSAAIAADTNQVFV